MVYSEWKFDTSIIPTLERIKARIELNKAAMIVIDGGVGEGKTTLATEIATWFEEEWLDEFEQYTAMGGTDFTKKLEKASKDKKKVVVYDEAGDFSSRSSLTSFNKTLNRVFETYRSTQALVILCLPDFSDLDKSLMKKRICRLLVHTHGRTKSYGRFKYYSLWRMWYLKEKMKEVTVPTQAYSMVTPNGRGLFKDLDKECRDRLARLSNKGKSAIRRGAYLREKGYIDTDEVCRELGVTTSYFYRIKKEHPYLQHKDIIGQKKFYDRRDVERAKEERGR